MNYLPVKSFDFDSPVTTVAGTVLIAAILLGVLFLFLMERAHSRDRDKLTDALFRVTVGWGVVAVLAALVGSAALFYDLAGFDRLNERNQIVQAKIEKDYDLQLSHLEFHDLNYPQVKPQEDFAVYGSIQKDLQLDGAAYRSAKLSLVWSEGKFYLSESTNGEDFKPLSPKR